jgi:hypothetical protein
VGAGFTLECTCAPLCLRDQADSHSTATTLLTWAMSVSSIGLYIDAGTRVKWQADADSCPVCIGNQSAGSTKPAQPFHSGHLAPPAHRDCTCCLIPHIEF